MSTENGNHENPYEPPELFVMKDLTSEQFEKRTEIRKIVTIVIVTLGGLGVLVDTIRNDKNGIAASYTYPMAITYIGLSVALLIWQLAAIKNDYERTEFTKNEDHE